MSKLPTHLYAVKDGRNTAFARLNPINNTWTCFEANEDSASQEKYSPIDNRLTYYEAIAKLQTRGHVVRKDANANLEVESQKYKRLEFGQFILGVAADANMSASSLMSALLLSSENLELVPDKLFELWLDSVSAKGSNPSYWTQDTDKVFWNIVNDADKLIRDFGEIPNDDDLLEMFNGSVLNLAYGVAANKSSRAFIQKSIGIGFLGRVFS